MKLTHYSRSVNPGYFHWYCSLDADVPEDDAADSHAGRTKLAQHVLQARRQLPWDGSHRGLHLVMSNAKRKAINQRCNDLERRARPKAVHVPGCDDDEPSF